MESSYFLLFFTKLRLRGINPDVEFNPQRGQKVLEDNRSKAKEARETEVKKVFVQGLRHST